MLVAYAQKQDTVPVFITVVDTGNHKTMKQIRNNTFTVKGILIGDKLYDKCLRPLPKTWEPLLINRIKEKELCNKTAQK